MQVTVEKTGPCEARVSFTVPRESYDREYAVALKSAGKGVRLKGFRPGKVPACILEREFGDQVKKRVVETFMSQAYSQAVEEHELTPVGHEQVALDDVALGEGDDLSHTFEVSLQPDFELGTYKGLEVVSELEPVMDEEIDDAISDLRLERATAEDAGEEGVPEEGVALCKIVWTHDGETVLERDGVRLAPLAPPPGVDGEAFKEALISKRSGEEFELEMKIPEDYEDESLRGQEAACSILVSEAFAMKPPPDEDLWKLLETDSDEDFRAAVRERMAQGKESREDGRREMVLFEQVLDAHDFDMPGRMLEAQFEGRRGSLRQELARTGVAEEDLDERVAAQDDESREAARKGVKALFLITRIAREEEITVDEEDMTAEIQAIAARYQAKVEEVVAHYQEHGLLQQVRIELLERKIRVFLRENAKITEP